jgi:hypothetical protein
MPTDDMTGVMDGPVRTSIRLYNDQPKFFDLPEEYAARFAALETFCKFHGHLTHLFHFSFTSITCFLFPLPTLLHFPHLNTGRRVTDPPIRGSRKRLHPRRKRSTLRSPPTPQRNLLNVLPSPPPPHPRPPFFDIDEKGKGSSTTAPPRRSSAQ